MNSSYFTDLLNDEAIVPSDGDFINIFNSQYESITILPLKRSLPSESNVVTSSTSFSYSNTTTVSSSSSSSFDVQQQQEQQVVHISSQSSSQQTIPQSRESVMSMIENMILELFDSLSIMKSLELSVLSRVTQRSNNTQSDDTGENQYLPEPRAKLLSLANGQSALTFARYIRILELIYEGLALNIVMTKRDVFYRDIPLFKTQPVVDRIIDDISCHFNVPRSCLNISASGKGRIYGPINIILRNYRVIDCMAPINEKVYDYHDDLGVLIPPINQILDVESYAKLLIVVEKEASFRHLVSVGFVQSQFQRCILVTGCGYPDLATRHMIKHITTRYPKMPILGLFDNDPYGLEIFSVYKWGSLAQSFDSVNLTIPLIQYLGLKYDDRSKYSSK
ncbi:unnamed protein product [Cunninghamella echinulata]